MAIATATALAVSAGVSALSSGASFAQAGKQKKRQQEAERAAAKSMAEAKSKLETNFYEELSVQKEPYELEREAALSGLGSMVQAGQAGERGVGELAGRAALYNQNQQAQTRAAMGKEMQSLDKLVADEDARLNNAKINLDLGEAAGQQQIAADARAARASANQQGVSGLGNAITTGLTVPGLYGGGGGGAGGAFASVSGQPTINPNDFQLTDQAQSLLNDTTFTGNQGGFVELPNTWQEFNSLPN
jgi:hypothetical protein|tara:strand:+ start:1917 stop:2654 length:738 start_codon:yes stop_codon:yes gene_type:complete